MYPNKLTREQLESIYRGRYPVHPSLYSDKERILAQLAKQEKEDLLNWLEGILVVMDHTQLESIFGELVRAEFLRPLGAEEVLEAIRQFEERSYAGEYYNDSDIESTSYSYVPPQTEAWFDELGAWLDRVCQLVADGQQAAAREGFEILLKLIDNMSNDIVYADELGDWMVITKSDYRAVYQQLTQQR